jgi:hypothetical protein
VLDQRGHSRVEGAIADGGWTNFWVSETVGTKLFDTPGLRMCEKLVEG